MDRLKLDGILEGTIEEQASPDATVRTIGLVIATGGQRTVVANQNLTITANASGNPRVDMIEWDGNALSVLAGTPAATPACPSPTAGSIPICLVFVPDSFVNVRNMNDISSPVANIMAYYHAVGGLFAQRYSNTTITVNDSTAEVTQTMLPLYFPRAGFRYRINHHILVRNTNTVATKSQLRVASGFDGAETAGNNPDASFVTMTPRDSGLIENYTVNLSTITGRDTPIPVGPLRISSLVDVGATGHADAQTQGQWISVEEIR